MVGLVLVLVMSIMQIPHSTGFSVSDPENPYNTQHLNPVTIGNDTVSKGTFHSFDSTGSRLVYIDYLPCPECSEESMPTISLMDLDGTNRTHLYTNETIDKYFTGPVMSPDGKAIVFGIRTYNEPSGRSLILLERNGTDWDSNATSMVLYFAENNSIENPSFSADGKRIVYMSTEDCERWDEKSDVWIMDLDGTNRTRLTDEKQGGTYPSLSPDGTKIAYLRSSSSGNRELWLANSDGSEPERLLDDSYHPAHPSFTSKGQILLTLGRPSPAVKESSWPTGWLMDPDTGDLLQVIPLSYANFAGNSYPRMSPDGNTIVVDHSFGNGSGIFRIENPDGNGGGEDRDGDSVADVIDGAPDDPNKGYYLPEEDEDKADILCCTSLLLFLLAIPASGLMFKL